MVELALLAPILILCLAGAMDFGRYFYTSTALEGAANAGVQYGVQSTAKSTDYTGMQNAAINAAPNISGVTAVATQFCECDSDNSSISCVSSCGSGVNKKTYVQVSVTGSYSLLSTYMFFQKTFSINAAADMRFT